MFAIEIVGSIDSRLRQLKDCLEALNNSGGSRAGQLSPNAPSRPERI